MIFAALPAGWSPAPVSAPPLSAISVGVGRPVDAAQRRSRWNKDCCRIETSLAPQPQSQ